MRGLRVPARTLLRFLHSDGDNIAGFSIETDAIEENGFSDTAEPIENEAPGGSSGSDTVQSDRSSFNHAVAASKLRGWSAGTGGIRVFSRIHYCDLTASY